MFDIKGALVTHKQIKCWQSIAMKNATLKTSKKARLFKCKEGVKYRCTYENGLIKCGKEFPVKSNALQHIRLVHREVPPISIDLEVVELEER